MRAGTAICLRCLRFAWLPVTLLAALVCIRALAFQNEPVVVALSIARYQSVRVSKEEVDYILARATGLLQESGCYVSIRRRGELTVLPKKLGDFEFDGVVTSSSQLAALQKQPGDIKIVHEIDVCQDTLVAKPGRFTSCTGGKNIVVTRLSDRSREGLLWAHEVGHLRGLSHNNTPGSIMNPHFDAGSDIRKLTASECQIFLTAR